MPRQPLPRPPAAPAPGFCRPARRLRAVAGLAAAGMVLAARVQLTGGAGQYRRAGLRGGA